jgi:excisionase family DNA binding protein
MSKNAENHWRLVLSVQEAARACGLSRATIYRLITAGKLTTVKVRARRLVPVASIDALLREGTK